MPCAYKQLFYIFDIKKFYNVYSKGMRSQSYVQGLVNIERLLIILRSDDDLIKKPKLVTLENLCMCWVRLF